jgi:DNA-binding transcriptional regulator YiaG
MQVHVNPFFGLRSAANLTLGDLSAYTRIDVRALRRCEKGLYTKPLPRLVEYWVNSGKISEGQLVTEYEDFQYNTRQANHRLLDSLEFDPNSNIHPLRQLRDRNNLTGGFTIEKRRHGLGLTEFCESLCVPLDTVQWWEKKWRNQLTIPKGLMLALNQNGYSQKELGEFSDNFKQWRERHNTVRFH